MVYLALVYTLNGLSAALMAVMGKATAIQGLTGFLILTSVGVIAGWILVLIHRGTLRKKWLLAYLWAVFWVFPLTNVLTAVGWFYHVELRPEERAGGAVVDIGHFIWFLMLITWLQGKYSGTYMWRGSKEISAEKSTTSNS
jgi:hypothetical protein